MYAKYGGYPHDSDGTEVTTSQRTEYNERGDAVSIVKTVNLNGTLSASSQSGMTSAINGMLAAYKDGKDFTLYDDDGNPTPHVLTTRDADYGVRVIQPPSFTQGVEVYGLTRTYSIVLEATYEAGKTPELVSFVETVSTQGTGGPEFAIVELLDLQPDMQRVRNYTPVFSQQVGSAVGKTMYQVPSPPLALGQIQSRDTRIVRGTPEIVGGNARARYENYPIQWSYNFLSTTPVSQAPVPR